MSDPRTRSADVMKVNSINLYGRNAVVTGGARGIGYACAQRILDSGGRICLWDLDEAAVRRAAAALNTAGRVGIAVVDVSDDVSVKCAAVATQNEMDRIDILINNAGITGPNKPTWEYDPAEWRKVIDIDLTGPYLCARALLPGMIVNGYGRIVNVASVAGKEGNPNAPAYSAAKAGLIGLTKSMGKELVGSGIIVNCVTPAAARTDIFQPNERTAHRIHAVEDSDGSLRRDERDRRVGGLALLRRMQLQHGSGVRHFRRSGNVLRALLWLRSRSYGQ
jgi:NAD(P)-dependent dehydrogenase (short-subunit alcohol dehydrogenase family)